MSYILYILSCFMLFSKYQSCHGNGIFPTGNAFILFNRSGFHAFNTSFVVVCVVFGFCLMLFPLFLSLSLFFFFFFL